MDGNFAARLKEFRQRCHMSQEEFGAACGINQKTVSNLEKGRQPKALYLDQIEHSFPDLNMEWLRKGAGLMFMNGLTMLPPGREPGQPWPVAALSRTTGNATTRLSIAEPTREEYAALQEELRRTQEQLSETQRQLAQKEGKLSAVEEDRQWLRSQVGGKDEASADAATPTEPAPKMEAVRNHDYVEAAPEAQPRRAVGFQFGS